MKAINFLQKYFFIILFVIYFFIGISIVDNYGISIDEEFQRYSGLYWLNFVLDFLPFENLKINTFEKLNKISGFTLQRPEDYPLYGVIFDLPLAFFEVFFKIEDPKNYFLLRHTATFIIFFISSIYFYQILKVRFINKKIIFFGLLFFISSPRIFGDSFYNNKDLIFLSLVTISLYYFLNLLKNFNYKNIFLFSFFSAMTTAMRVLGIFFPVSYLFLILISKKLTKKKLLEIIYYFVPYFSFLILLWPYLWSDPINKFINTFLIFSNFVVKIQMLFNGEYVFSYLLPVSYLPIWIIITIPIIILATFFHGYLFIFKRAFARLVKIKNNTFLNDFWRGKRENLDIYIFFNFNLVFFYIILFNPTLFTGWRHLYFLHPFIIYMACVSVHILFLKFKKTNIIFHIVLLSALFNFYELVKFHPYQSLYFNSFVQGSKKKDFEIDYWGISGVKFLKELLVLDNSNRKISVATASYIPLERSLKLLNKEERNKFNIIGQDYSNADYIFNNNMSEVNKKIDEKYKIPSNFILMKEYSIDGFLIYQIYKNTDN